jgi:hypothetical protein
MKRRLIDVSKFPDDTEVPSFARMVVCAKCGARGRHIDVRQNWKEQLPAKSLTGKQWRWLRHILERHVLAVLRGLQPNI